jgi:hypothetical protein
MEKKRKNALIVKKLLAISALLLVVPVGVCLLKPPILLEDKFLL